MAPSLRLHFVISVMHATNKCQQILDKSLTNYLHFTGAKTFNHRANTQIPLQEEQTDSAKSVRDLPERMNKPTHLNGNKLMPCHL